MTSGTADLVVGDWLARRAGRLRAVDVDFIDLEAARLPDHGMAAWPAEGAQPSAVHDLAPWLTDADGFVVVLPGSTHGVPRPVRNALDWCTSAWAGKPVALVRHGHAAHDALAAHEVRSAFRDREASVVGAVNVCGPQAECAEHRLADQDISADRLLGDVVAGARRTVAASVL
ncbi:NADPH-dependent FMN reductase [Phytoactinopolyspora endophytica]|uniref:NADPH-dependent FMN reductase n=1 Tax=Phytoactinopolyspora endophytica TaxID=1642495 RepID=UPI0013EB599A|nr:NAD(P)H-dependent oxidoreductase [Phytoactinopolyspora endophytica]